jgi:hypothetical protein
MTSARRKAARANAKQRRRLRSARAVIDYATNLAERLTSGEISAEDMEHALVECMTPNDRADLMLASFLVNSAPLEDRQYWAQVRAMWGSLSAPSDYIPIWRAVFMNPRGEGDGIMFNVPRESFPELVPVYRGVRHESYARGMCWTTDRAMAELFARQKCWRWTADGFWPSDPPVPVAPVLVTGQVDRDDIVCCFRHPTCDELVIFPEHVEVLTVERLDEAPESAYDASDKQAQSGRGAAETAPGPAHGGSAP